MRFSFTGTLDFKDDKFVREGKTKNGDNYISINASVVAEKTNRAYVESFGMYQSKILTYDTDGNKIEVDYADRNDSSILDKVADFRKHVVVDEDGNRKVFISDYDFNNYLVSIKDELKGSKVTVTGTTSVNVYKGNITQRFNIQNIYFVNDEERKNKLIIKDTFYWDKDGVDSADFASEKKLYINGYILSYISKAVGNKYIAHQAVIDCSKLNFENEKHVNLLKAKLLGLGLTYEDGKIKNKLKSGKYFKQLVEFSYVNGNEVVEFSEDELTDYQKELIELGLKTIDEFKPNGSIYGQRIVEYKIKSFDGRGDYADGFVTLDVTEEEFEDDIYVAPKEESVEELEKSIEKKESPASVEDDEDIEDLFD